MLRRIISSSLRSIFLFVYSLGLLPVVVYFMIYNVVYLLEWNILSFSTCNLTFLLVFDAIRLSFSSLVCLIAASVTMFSSSYISHETFLKRFILLVILFVASMNLLVFIPSLPSLLLGWDGLGIVSFALVIYYQNIKSLGAGMFTILANRVGDVIILISIGLLVIQGHWAITLLWDFDLKTVFAATITIAAITKRAQIPFSRWLPAAIAAPTPVSALVHSSTLVTAGVFLVIRFYPFLETVSGFKSTLLFISVVTLLIAGIAANYETDLKKVIALSTLSQLGVIIISLGIGFPYLALFHLYTHALFKALLFLCAGTIIHNSSNSQDIRSIGIYFNQGPLTITCINIANLSLCGAPFLSGFFSKDLILEQSLSHPTRILILILAFVATGLTAAYSIRLSMCSLWGTLKSNSFHAKSETDFYINWPTIILGLCAIGAGAAIQSVALEFNPSLILLPGFHKFLTITVILAGLFIVGVLWSHPSRLVRFNISKFEPISTKAIRFFSLMWFISPLSTQPLTKLSIIQGRTILKSVDQGWLEILGGQGTLISTNALVSYNQITQKLRVKWLMAFFIIRIVILLLLINLS